MSAESININMIDKMRFDFNDTLSIEMYRKCSLCGHIIKRGEKGFHAREHTKGECVENVFSPFADSWLEWD